MIDFGRDICGVLPQAENREWLVTNGLGGFASGTIAGLLTRRYHGLLTVALGPLANRMLLVSKLDETATYAGAEYPLYVNRWTGGVVSPDGYQRIERFHLEGTTPVWTFAVADALLEKRVWMPHGANTTYTQYHLRRATEPLSLKARALVNYRHYHSNTHGGDWQMEIAPVARGLKVTAYDDAIPFYVLSDRATATPQHDWHRRFFLMKEANRGLNAIEDHLHAGDLKAELQPGQSLTVAVSVEANPSLDGSAVYTERRRYEEELLVQAEDFHAGQTEKEGVRQLLLAADQFVVKRPLPQNTEGHAIVAGYPWLGNWGRDTLIALPGLTLVTGRADVAADILRAFANTIDQGMLPARLPEAGEDPEYDTVDTTLWYFEAIRAYYAATGDDMLLQQLFPALKDIVTWQQQGTRHNIHVDVVDGLLYAGQEGQSLTWMGAVPRTGKPVEVNALWYNALRHMAEFARVLGKQTAVYDELAQKAQEGFGRFWNDQLGYCYDVLDTPQGHDASLRPNQLLAVSLPHSPLMPAQQKAVVDTCARRLLTSHGVRSLAPDDSSYIGSYGGDANQRHSAHHQGTAWAWLLGPFVQAHLRVYNDPVMARSFLLPLLRHHLADHGLGSVCEICDGDPPFTPRGCLGQAWSVAELLRAGAVTQNEAS